MFVKRAAKFMQGLLESLDTEEFIAVNEIEDVRVARESDEDKTRTINVMAMQGYVEKGVDANGNITLRLTESGVQMSKNFIQEGK